MKCDELLKIIKERRSVRDFTTDKVSDQDINDLIDGARYAPSNTNRQAWKFIIIKNDGIKSRIARVVQENIEALKEKIDNEELFGEFFEYSSFSLFFSKAPVVIVALYKNMPSVIQHVLSRTEKSAKGKMPPPEVMSVSMAIQNLLLTAHTLDLGACCMTTPLIAAESIKSILDINPPFEIAAFIPVGRYEKRPEPTPRKDIDRIAEIIE